MASETFSLADAKFQKLETAGRGASGNIFKVICLASDNEDLEVDKHYALKEVQSNEKFNYEALQRHLKEAHFICNVDHPNILQGYGFALESNRFLLLMEYISGDNMEIMVRRQRVELREACRMVSDIANALLELQELACVHRDIKPANIVRSKSTGCYVLLDFGILKDELALTSPDELLGTVLTMSPEQADFDRKSALDVYSDVYSLGITFFYVLTGHYPEYIKPNFSGLQQIQERAWKGLVSPLYFEPDLPYWVHVLFSKMTAYYPHERFSPSEIIAFIDKQQDRQDGFWDRWHKRRVCKKWKRNGPSLAEHFYQRASIWRSYNELQWAIEDYSKALEYNPSHRKAADLRKKLLKRLK